MTVFDASIVLYKWFGENDVFCMENHFQQAVLITDDPEADMATFSAALKQFAEGEIVVMESYENKKYYILKKPLDSLDQDITVTHPLALKMALQINAFCEHIKDFQDTCNPSEIQQRDLYNLTFIIDYFIEKENPEND